MKTFSTRPAWVFFSLIVLTGYRQPVMAAAFPRIFSSVIVNGFKQWHEEKRTALLFSSGAFIPAAGIPQWGEMFYSEERNCYLIPVKLDMVKRNKQFTVEKFLLIQKEGCGLTAAYYYIITRRPGHTNDMPHILARIDKAATGKEAVRSHDIIKSPLHVKSKETLPGDYIVYRPTDSAANRDNPTSTDWFYEEHDVYGNIICEEYLFTTGEVQSIDHGP